MSDKTATRSGLASQCPHCFRACKDPRLLSCRHSFCRTCIEKFVVVKSVSCPICEKSSHVPWGDATKLMKDLVLTGLVDTHHNSHVSSCLKCNDCRDYERREPAVHCYSCQKSLCCICSSSHRQYRHSVVDIAEYESESMKIREMTTKALVERTKAKEKTLDQRMNLVDNQMQRVKSVSSNIRKSIMNSFDDHIQRLEDLRDQLVEETEDRQDFLLGKLKTVHDFTKTFKDFLSNVSGNLLKDNGKYLRGDALKNHIKLCHELEMLLYDDVDLDMLKETSAFAEGFVFRANNVRTLSMGSIGKVDDGWRLGFDIDVQSDDDIQSMCATPDGRIAIGFSSGSGGLVLYAPDKMIEVPEAMQGTLIRSVAFLPDGTCVILDHNNTISLYSSTSYEKLGHKFDTIHSDDAGVGHLCVDEHYFVYVAYKMERLIHKFSPLGGKPLGEFTFHRIDPLDLRVSQEGAFVLMSWRKILALKPSGNQLGELQNSASDRIMVADVSSTETLIVGFLKQRMGDGNPDKLTVQRFNLDTKLSLKETLFGDYPIAVSPSPFYCIRELITGEIAFCTKSRLYLFQHHSGTVEDVGFSDFGVGCQYDKSRDASCS